MFSSLHALQKNIILIFEFKGRSDGKIILHLEQNMG